MATSRPFDWWYDDIEMRLGVTTVPPQPSELERQKMHQEWSEMHDRTVSWQLGEMPDE